MKTSTLHLFQPISTPEWASSCLEGSSAHAQPPKWRWTSKFSSCTSEVLENYSNTEATHVLSAAPWAERRGCRVGAAQWSEYVFLNDYVNLNSPVLQTIQIYPADCILYTIYCIFKETGALYAYFSTSIHGKSSSSEVWMTVFFSQYNRLFSFSLESIVNYELWKLQVFCSFMLGW